MGAHSYDEIKADERDCIVINKGQMLGGGGGGKVVGFLNHEHGHFLQPLIKLHSLFDRRRATVNRWQLLHSRFCTMFSVSSLFFFLPFSSCCRLRFVLCVCFTRIN